MIQNYLKTGMVFYDDQSKQHFRQDCCKETFCQFTDNEHFPSFQFVVDGHWPFLGFGNWHIFDLDDNDLGVWVVATPDLSFYHHGDSIYNISHDYRDIVAFPGIVDYETCYYLSVDIGLVSGEFQTLYSEAFRVCDCETEGAGDGIDLIENGWFEDWVIVPPNAWDDYPLGWTLVNNDNANYVVDAGGECQMISDNASNIFIRQPICTIGEWYVWSLRVTVATSGAIIVFNGVNLETITTTGFHTGVFQATGVQFAIFEGAPPNVDITFTDVRVEEFIGFEFCDMLTLNWWSDCDWDDIIYQDGYRNSLVLNVGLDTPKEEITGNAPSERLGDKKFSDIVIKKHYRLIERIPEYLWNALIRLPAYGSNMPNFHAWIVLPDGSTGEMKEVDVLGEWDKGNCMNTFTIEFIDDEYPVVATNCCADEDVSEV